MRPVRFVFLLVCLHVIPVASATGLVYPPTPTQAVSEQLGNAVIADPYRWLERDPRNTPQVASWMQEQNQLSRRYLDAVPGRAAIAARLRTLSEIESCSLPRRAGDRSYFLGRAAGDERASLWLQRDGQAAERLLDPLQLDPGGDLALAGWALSPDGRHIAFATRVSGSDWRSWRVLDTATGRVLPDRLDWNKFSDAFWSADGGSLYYTRFPAPAAGSELTAANRNQFLARHVLGTPSTQDTLIYQQPEYPDYLFKTEVSSNGRWLVINSGYDGGGAFIGVRALAGGTLERPFQRHERIGVSYRYIGSRGDLLYFLTNQGDDGDRIVCWHAGQSEGRAQAEQVLSSRGGVIERASVQGGLLLATLLEKSAHRVLLLDIDRGTRQDLPLPAVGSVSELMLSNDAENVDFQFSAFAIPASHWRYSRSTQQLTPRWQPRAPLMSADYITEQLTFRARDGKLLSMFIVRRRDLKPDPHTAVLLRGYGGFGLSQPPSFSAEYLTWMDMGGIYAYPSLPGGGEYGEAWHRAGMREHKPAVFAAYLDAAEQLIARGWTSPGRVVASGASNGGLLVGAAMTQRPALFGAALPDVAVLDMLRFSHFSNGGLWSVEYGDPADPAMLPVLLGYSPYHKLHAGQPYPPTLVTTADNDDRVSPAHSFKFAARLQAVAPAGVPVLLSTTQGAGHSGGTRISQIVQAATDRLAFVAQALQMPAPVVVDGVH